MKEEKFILWFNEIRKEDVVLVGGKNANLGEMFQNLSNLGIRIPNGFAITTKAYEYFINFNNLAEKIKEILEKTNIYNIEELQQVGETIRNLIKQGEFPEDLKNEILDAFEKLKEEYFYEYNPNNSHEYNANNFHEYNTNNSFGSNSGNIFTVAVRSSASAEDLPDASFAGQQETYLNVTEKDLLEKVKYCFASLFTDRAIFYRQEKGFDHFQVKLSVGVQKMVRSDLANSGVMFTIDSDSGLNKVIVINGVWGLGELIVQGKIIPDEWIIFKERLEKGYKSIISRRLGEKIKKIVYQEGGGTKEIETSEEEKIKYCLNDDEVLELAKMGLIIEKHYGRAMDIEWAKDGIDGKLYIVQARAETVHSTKKFNVYEEYRLNPRQSDFDPRQSVVLKGIAIGSKITSGKVKVIKDVSKINEFQEGEILVTEMTDPDWVPIMKKAKGIITDKGGRTCFTGDTKILTNRGFMEIKDVVEKVNNGEKIKVLSLNTKTFKLEWKDIINGFKRKAEVIKINISQTGKAKNNFLKVTPSHKFLTFDTRNLIEKSINKIIADKGCVLSLKEVPFYKGKNYTPKLGYILGAIFTDGHIYLTKTHGEIQFIQKETEKKLLFIQKVQKYFQEVFNKELKRYKKIETMSKIRGRVIKGWAIKFRCYSKNIAHKFKEFYDNIDRIIISASKEFVLNFLAGVIDGDGTWSKDSGVIHIFVSKEKLLQAITLACLRLGISWNVTSNRSIFNFQLVDNFEEIFEYTSRIKGHKERRRFGSVLFNAKQLLRDIVDRVNYKGRIKPYVNQNLLIDSTKIKNYIIPMIKGSLYNHELTKIINSPLKMLRVNLYEDFKKIYTDVYNIEVADNHNYIVSTSKYTPILVANCHAAIVSRELGIPAIVGTQKATEVLKTGDEITIDCSGGITGYVYKGLIDYEVIEHNFENLPETKTKVYVNIGLPDEAWEKWYLPVKGVGLAREEFIIAEEIKIHPNALIDYPFDKAQTYADNTQTDADKSMTLNYAENKNTRIGAENNISVNQRDYDPRISASSSAGSTIKQKIDELTFGYEDKKQYFIDKLAEGIAKICVAYYSYEVIVRFSDFKTNEYRNLIGGELYEPQEENPMIGWRGASRYYHPKFKRAFELEVLAMKKVREKMGVDNLVMMVPFCRTPEEGRKIMEIIENIMGPRKEKGYKVYVMCEIPSNILQADEFLEIFDGMSIGSNDLTQLTLGIDRDNEILQSLADERNESVKRLIAEVIRKCKEKGKYIGICGQAPSDFPEMVEFLVKEGIESISVNSDVVIKTIEMVKKFEDENR
ncbi:MAG: intein-containing phosphoenolpyruvate-binding protein [Candidatus Parcubacteria bacterium]|nr:MAG: intein-containing phosphoenolpyruvate-binding protein [Candidatus Parcubacteria bacterium]